MSEPTAVLCCCCCFLNLLLHDTTTMLQTAPQTEHTGRSITIVSSTAILASKFKPFAAACHVLPAWTRHLMRLHSADTHTTWLTPPCSCQSLGTVGRPWQLVGHSRAHSLSRSLAPQALGSLELELDGVFEWHEAGGGRGDSSLWTCQFR